MQDSPNSGGQQVRVSSGNGYRSNTATERIMPQIGGAIPNEVSTIVAEIDAFQISFNKFIDKIHPILNPHRLQSLETPEKEKEISHPTELVANLISIKKKMVRYHQDILRITEAIEL